MKVLLVVGCLLASTLAAPSHSKDELLEMLVRKLLKDEVTDKAVGLSAMRKEISELQSRASRFLSKRGLDSSAANFAEYTLEVAKRLNVEGIRAKAISACGGDESSYLSGAFAEAEQLVASGSGRSFGDADDCFKNAVSDALTHSIRLPNGDIAPSADKTPEACEGDSSIAQYCDFHYENTTQ